MNAHELSQDFQPKIHTIGKKNLSNALKQPLFIKKQSGEILVRYQVRYQDLKEKGLTILPLHGMNAAHCILKK